MTRRPSGGSVKAKRGMAWARSFRHRGPQAIARRGQLRAPYRPLGGSVFRDIAPHPIARRGQLRAPYRALGGSVWSDIGGAFSSLGNDLRSGFSDVGSFLNRAASSVGSFATNAADQVGDLSKVIANAVVQYAPGLIQQYAPLALTLALGPQEGALAEALLNPKAPVSQSQQTKSDVTAATAIASEIFSPHELQILAQFDPTHICAAWEVRCHQLFGESCAQAPCLKGGSPNEPLYLSLSPNLALLWGPDGRLVTNPPPVTSVKQMWTEDSYRRWKNWPCRQRQDVLRDYVWHFFPGTIISTLRDNPSC